MASNELQNSIDRAAQTLDMDSMDVLRGAQSKLLDEYDDGDGGLSSTTIAAAQRLQLQKVLPDDTDLDTELATVLSESADAAEEVAEINRENAIGGDDNVPDEAADLRPPGSPHSSSDHEAWKQKRRSEWRESGHISENPHRINARVHGAVPDRGDYTEEDLDPLKPGESGQKARENAEPGHFSRTPGVDEDGD